VWPAFPYREHVPLTPLPTFSGSRTVATAPAIDLFGCDRERDTTRSATSTDAWYKRGFDIPYFLQRKEAARP